jgi:hypothetical protein
MAYRSGGFSTFDFLPCRENRWGYKYSRQCDAERAAAFKKKRATKKRAKKRIER